MEFVKEGCYCNNQWKSAERRGKCGNYARRDFNVQICILLQPWKAKSGFRNKTSLEFISI